MKKNFLTLTVALATSIATLNAQNVHIPDANFKAFLLGHTGINTNSDSEIQVSEAEAYTGVMNCEVQNIADLTGIEAFTNLTGLYCYNNLLTNLDLSSNTALTLLNCSDNPLTSLNVSNNTALIALDCSHNQLTSLDVSNNTALTLLACGGNQLTSLDVRNKTALALLECQSNQLTSLYLNNGNNTNLTQLWADNNPNLSCIQVDDSAYSTANWINGNPDNDDPYLYDTGVTFSEDCGYTTGIADLTANKNAIGVYPNPTNNIINFSVQTNAQLTNVTGQIIANKTNVNTLDITDQPTGIYFITLTDNNGQVLHHSRWPQIKRANN